MNYLFIYYTGTFNTRFLTKKIAEKLTDENDTYKIVEINKNIKPINTYGFDIIGLGFPIYAFNSPLPFNNYLKKLKFKNNQKFFIYKNSGEAMKMNNSASRIPLNIMKKNKCKFIGEYHFLFPYNIHFPFSKDLICALLNYDKKLLEIMSYNLKNNIIRKINSDFFLDAGAFAFSIQKLGGNFNSYFYKVNTKKCILCGQCIANCPQKNISIKNNKITFGHNCDMCMRCSFFCPNHAIETGMLQSWNVSNYYNLDELWEEDKIYNLSKCTPFYKSYQKAFDKIDKEYTLLQ